MIKRTNVMNGSDFAIRAEKEASARPLVVVGGDW